MKEFIAKYKDQLALTIVIVAGLAIVAALIALFVYNNTPKVVYQPTDACTVFTLPEAQELLGEAAVQSGIQAPTNEGNFATSRCGYTDANVDAEKLIVAAVTVRSGFNDNGASENRVEFTQATPTSNIDEIQDLGDKAYFNHRLGQLNVLSDRDWYIFSYGIGSDPGGNTPEDAVEFAKKVLN